MLRKKADLVPETASPVLSEPNKPLLITVPESRTPAGAHTQWVNNAGVNLRVAHWKPTSQTVKGTICLIQGRTEFIEKYYEVIQDLRERGFAVLAFDFRGQGGSDRLLPDPTKGHVEEFDDYVTDLQRVVKDVMLPECPAPFFALAHSMGGAVLLRSVDRGHLMFDRIVLSAPMIGLYRKRLSQRRVASMAKMLNAMGLSEQKLPFYNPKAFEGASIDDNLLTSDEARYQKTVSLKKEAEFLDLSSPTIGWLNAACDAMDSFNHLEFGRNNRTPILAISCGADQVVSVKAAERLFVSMRSSWMITIPGARHEIMQERDRFRNQFWSAFEAFIPGTDSGLMPTGA